MKAQQGMDTQAVDLERADKEKTPSEIFGDPPKRWWKCDSECMESKLKFLYHLVTTRLTVFPSKC